jgi:hypothetical protein
MEDVGNHEHKYMLYLAEMQIDGEGGFPPLFAYGIDEEQARKNMQSVYSPEDWKRPAYGFTSADSSQDSVARGSRP